MGILAGPYHKGKVGVPAVARGLKKITVDGDPVGQVLVNERPAFTLLGGNASVAPNVVVPADVFERAVLRWVPEHEPEGVVGIDGVGANGLPGSSKGGYLKRLIGKVREPGCNCNGPSCFRRILHHRFQAGKNGRGQFGRLCTARHFLGGQCRICVGVHKKGLDFHLVLADVRHVHVVANGVGVALQQGLKGVEMHVRGLHHPDANLATTKLKPKREIFGFEPVVPPHHKRFSSNVKCFIEKHESK